LSLLEHKEISPREEGKAPSPEKDPTPKALESSLERTLRKKMVVDPTPIIRYWNPPREDAAGGSFSKPQGLS